MNLGISHGSWHEVVTASNIGIRIVSNIGIRIRILVFHCHGFHRSTMVQVRLDVY